MIFESHAGEQISQKQTIAPKESLRYRALGVGREV
jgi:hypothetical protein